MRSLTHLHPQYTFYSLLLEAIDAKESNDQEKLHAMKHHQETILARVAVHVHIEAQQKGVPKELAHIFVDGFPNDSTKSDIIRKPAVESERILEPIQRKFSTKRTKNLSGSKAKCDTNKDQVIETEPLSTSKTLVGFVTTGHHSLIRGRGFGLGCISASCFLKLAIQKAAEGKQKSNGPIDFKKMLHISKYEVYFRNVSSRVHHRAWISLP